MDMTLGALRETWRDDARDVYVSPHADDVCFSLGGRLARRKGGLLVTVFTRSCFAPGLRGGFELDEAAVTAVRTREDLAFCAKADMRLIQLHLPEPRLRGDTPRGVPTSAEVERVEAALAPLLTLATEPSTKKVAILFPTGIGEHRDHIAVAQFGLRHLTALERGFRVGFYEDLPYVATYGDRPWNDEARGALRALGLQRHTADYVWEEKLELLRCYRSQLDAEPSRRDFTAAPGQDAEAWWQLDRAPSIGRTA